MKSLSSKAFILLVLALFPLAGLVCGAEADSSAPVEWVMTLGCRHCHYGEQTGVTTCKGNCGPAAARDGKVFMLTGAALPKDFKKGGEWLVKGTVSADGKTVAVKEMVAQAPAAADLQEQPARSPAGAQSHTGAVARTGAGLPTFTTAEQKVYHLKAAKTASKLVSHTLTRIGGGELKGNFTVAGTTYEDDSHTWIVIDSIHAADSGARP